MNPNWTGRSARTLDECRFWNADPIERSHRHEGIAGLVLAVVIGVMLALALVHWWAS